jgi:hypothetical protein
MKNIYYNFTVNKPRHADDQTAIGFSISVSPECAHAQITTLLSIAGARELSLKIAQAADQAELKLDEK